MDFSHNLYKSCEYIFRADCTDGIPKASIEDLSNHLMFNHELRFNVSSTSASIPMIGRKKTQQIIYDELNYKESFTLSEVSIPLYVGNTLNKRTFESMWTSVVANTRSWQYRLTRVKNNNDDTWYIGNGLILNSNFEPLLMVLGNYTIEDTIVGETILKNCYYNEIIVQVSPKVFEKTNTINTGIIKKIIPLLTTNTISYPANSVFSFEHVKDTPITAVIKEFDDCIISPIKPLPDEDIQSTFNKCLVDNKQDIFQMFNLHE